MDEQIVNEITDSENELTPSEMEMLKKYFGASSPTPDEKYTVHKFLHDIVVSRDTTKTANLDAAELGMPKLPVRTLKELALFCKDIANMDYFGEYFDKEAEIVNATSLSKEAKLIDLSVLSRNELGLQKKKRRPNKGWFGFNKKNDGDDS